MIQSVKAYILLPTPVKVKYKMNIIHVCLFLDLKNVKGRF